MCFSSQYMKNKFNLGKTCKSALSCLFPPSLPITLSWALYICGACVAFLGGKIFCPLSLFFETDAPIAPIVLHNYHLENATAFIARTYTEWRSYAAWYLFRKCTECDFQGQVLWEGLRRDALKSSNLRAHMQSFFYGLKSVLNGLKPILKVQVIRVLWLLPDQHWLLPLLLFPQAVETAAE